MPYMQYNRALSLRASQAGAGAMGGDAESTVEMESLLDAIADREETINRGFTTDKGIPVLGDCNNYYSGEYEGKFWHQNADQVYVYIPVSPNIQRGDIDVKFEARAVHASVEGMEPFSFPCSGKKIPNSPARSLSLSLSLFSWLLPIVFRHIHSPSSLRCINLYRASHS